MLAYISNIQKIQPIYDLCYFMGFMTIAIAIIMVDLFEMLLVCINRLVKFAWLRLGLLNRV